MRSEKNKILFLGALKSRTKDGSLGGMFIVCRSLADFFGETEHEVIELNTTYKSKGVGNKITFINKIKTIVFRNILFYYKMAMHYNSKVLLVFVSAGNSFIEKSYLIKWGRFFGMKVILFPRSGHLLADFERNKYKRAITISLEKSDFIICQSEFWKDYFQGKGVSEQKLIVVENWYPRDLIDKSRKLDFKTHFQEKLKVVFMARLEEGKGIEDLIEFAKDYGSNFKIEIDIYGSGTFENDLKYLSKKSDVEHIIKFKGWLSNEEKLQKVNKYDLAVFTSRFEGYPNTLLDYIFAKIPVLTTNIESVKAVGKEHFMYYEPGNIKHLKEQISYVYNNYPQLVKSSKILYNEKLIENNIDYSANKILELIN